MRPAFPLPALLAATALAAGASSALAQPPPVSPSDFVAAAGGADRYETMAAHIALVESRDAGVRSFAHTMLTDHEAAFSALAQAAGRAGAEPPSGGVGADQAALLAALQSLRGAEFDKAYARQQVVAHAQALATEEGYAQNGSAEPLKAQARADVEMIRRHQAQAQALSRAKGD